MFITSRESAPIVVTFPQRALGLNRPVEEFPLSSRGGKLRCRSELYLVNTGRSSENFWFLQGFPVYLWFTAAFMAEEHQNPEPERSGTTSYSGVDALSSFFRLSCY